MSVLGGRAMQPFYSTLDSPHVSMGSMPVCEADVVYPREQRGVGAVVDMCREIPALWLPACYAANGMSCCHLPTADLCEPALEDIMRGVEFMRVHIDRGTRVFIHCKGGRGRATIMALCWLVYGCGHSRGEAMSIVKRGRSVAIGAMKNGQ